MSNEIITAVLAFAGAFIVNAAWGWINKSRDEEWANFRTDLKKNTEAVMSLTLALQRTEIELTHILKDTKKIPEIEKDLTSLHSKVRALGGNG